MTDPIRAYHLEYYNRLHEELIAKKSEETHDCTSPPPSPKVPKPVPPSTIDRISAYFVPKTKME